MIGCSNNKKYKLKIKTDFNKAARCYDQHAIMQSYVASKLFNFAKTEIKQASNILDAGCGSGFFARQANKYGITGNIVQADIAFNMCAYALANGHITVCSDIHLLAFKKYFDLIFSSLVLQWSPSLSCALDSFSNTLLSSGKLCLSVVAENSLYQLKKAFETCGVVAPIHKFIIPSILKQKLQETGFTNITISEEQIIYYYGDITSLLKSIKVIGGSYKANDGINYYGKGFFSKVEEVYIDKFGRKEGLPLSWNIVYAKASKERC